jgi:hypothetical protein
VGDEKTDDEIAAGPIVPPDLVPAVERPAKPRPAPLWKSVSVAVVAVLVLAGVGLGLWRADALWGTRAMVTTAVAGVEALVQGDADGLATLGTPELAKQLTPEVRADMKRVGALVDFADPTWVGDRAEIEAMIGPAQGHVVLAPDPRAAGTVAFNTSGSLGSAVGAVVLVRDWGGWRISGIQVQPTK